MRDISLFEDQTTYLFCKDDTWSSQCYSEVSYAHIILNFKIAKQQCISTVSAILRHLGDVAAEYEIQTIYV